nr:coat protein [Wheat yellow stripe virus]
MVYSNWNYQLNNYMSDRWVRLSDIMAVLKGAEAYDLSKASNLELVKQTFSDLGKVWSDEQPFVAPAVRFSQTTHPTSGALILWINLSEGANYMFYSRIMNLTDSVTAPNSSADARSAVVSKSSMHDNTRNEVGTKDGTYNLHRVLQSFQAYLRSAEPLWTRERFERDHELTWIEHRRDQSGA